MNKQSFALALWIVLVSGLIGWAASGQSGYPAQGIVASGYSIDAQTLAGNNVRTSVAGIDTPLSTAVVLALPAFQVLGRPTLMVHGRFTNSGATVGIQLAYVYKKVNTATSSDTDPTNNTIKEWSAPITLTAGTVQKEGSYYESPPQYFDSNGAVTIRVVCSTAPSAGTVTLVTGSE